MTAWSRSEANRTIDEVKRRSVIDPSFRALALTDPLAALGKVNPRPMPAGFIQFVERAEELAAQQGDYALVVLLPEPGTELELSVDDLEDVAGGVDTAPPPPPPVNLT